MKIQELAIIFVIIILPISLLLSEYTQFQIQTLKTQTEYDSKLTAATYDAIKAFQLNSTNSTESGLANSEMRDLTASVNTFRNSLMSTFKLNGYTEEELNSYIPALVYTLYDGFYLYSPYQNENHRYEIALDGDGNQRIDHITGEVLEYVQDGAGNDLKIDGNGEKLYGVKPYISYSCRYIRGNTDVVITYALDNHITVQGMIGDSYVNRSGYLIEIDDTGTSEFGIYYKQEDEDTEIVKYNGEIINEEHLKEFLPLRNANPDDDVSETCIYSYAKINGIKYYLIPQYYEVKDYDGNTIGYKDCIVYLFNGDPIIQAKRGDGRFDKYEEWIKENGTAKKYYKDAYFFTKWLQEDSGLRFLRYKDAYDEIINTDPNDGITDGQIDLVQLWPGDETRIFKFNDGGLNSKSIETEFSNFNQHRLAVIRKKIEINLAIAIRNYNSYSNVNNIFQIPQLKETEWDSITHNIALISFMQGLPIGGKIYNGYSIVTNSESDKVVFEENIYILSDNADSPSGQKTYCRIGDEDLETPTSGKYSNDTESDPPKSAGRLNLDFERSKVIANGEMTYYYPLPEYNASYNSVVMQDNVKTYDDIYEYIESPEKTDIAQAFYTALARERGGLYVPFEDIIDSPSYDDDFGNPDIDEWVKITYHLKDETNSHPIEDYVKVGVEIQLRDPYREGYELLGWAVNPNATEADFKKGTEKFEKYTPVDDRSLYAVWKLTEYTITYDANGGTNVPTAQTKQHGVDIPLTLLPIPTRDGYIFKGWATTSNATIAKYQPGDLFGINAHTTLYAVWEADIYEITYDANSGIGAPEKQFKKHGEGLILSSTQPTREGYNFKGWSTTSNATIAEYQPGGTYTENADVILYAVWEVKTYTVTYDANGGTGVPEAQTKEHGIDLTLISLTSEELPTREGYDFIGWAETPTATSAKYQPGDQYKDNKDIKLYAVWKPYTYIVAYNANGGSGAPEAQTKTHGVDLTLSTTKPTKTGYIFEGWAENSKATITEIKYQPGDTYKTNAPITLYAVWKPDTYTVTYNANGGTGAPAAQTKKHGVDLILSSTIPTRDGYDFKGWAEKSTATSAKYQPGETYSNDANTTLYAVWKLKTYNVTYDANGGTGAPSAQTKTHGKDLTLSTGRPSREGYNFKGWAENSTATSATYQPGGKYTENKETILYAVWELNTYIITYNANGGTGAPAAQTKTHGQDLTLSSTQPTREGHNFMGWAEVSTEKTAKYQPGDTYKENGNATLYAVWEAKKYPVIYDANGGSGAPETQEKIYEEDLTLSEKIPVRTGYTFIGWGQFSDATSPSYNPGDIYKTNAPITLYAIWEIDVYTVSYNANEGTGAPDTQFKKHGEDLILSSTQPTREGYDFKGWAETSTATSATYQAGGKYTTDANTTLYAVWELKTYNVTYNANGGSGAPDTQIKTHGIDLTLSPTIPTREGHKFKGWATSANATKPKYQPEENYTENKELVLYAVWEINTYTVTYNANGGIGAPEPQTKTHGKDLTLSDVRPTKEGYVFKGWGESAISTSAKYQPEDKYTTNANIELYAVWQKAQYVITYDANGGIGAPDPQNKIHGESLTLSSTQPTRDGYNFMGWAETSTETTAKYQPEGTYSKDGNATLYAVWKAKTYTVKYNAKGGTGAPDAQTKTHEIDLTLSSTIPTKTGHEFKGWATSSAATSVKYQPGGNFTENRDVTLYAVWEKEQYVITFEGNGGTFSGGATQMMQTVSYGGELTPKPTREGYLFRGWDDSPEATKIVYEYEDIYYGTANITLYAVWEANIYTIHYDANGGTGEPEDQIKIQDEELTLSSVKPTREGYNFMGWAETSTATSATYQPGGKYTDNKEATLYAVWEVKTYTVKYNTNGGTEAPDEQTKTHGEDLILTSEQPTRDGHNFKGWATSSNATIAKYQPGATYTENKSITLYAVWEVKKYPVIYDANGGSGAPDAQEKIHAVDLTLSETIPVKTGHTFIGWAETSTATVTEIKYQPGDTYKTNAQITLYAIWEIDVYTVTYNANGGSGEPANQIKTHGVDMTLSTIVPTREGYDFKGWAESSTATVTEIKYQPGGTYSNDVSTTLYAVWELKTYNITYNANGGNGAPGVQIKTHGVDMTLSTIVPTRDGHNFKGWAESATATSAKYQPGEDFNENKEVTLYAVWEVKTYTVTYNANGGIGEPSNQTKTHGTDLKLSSTVPTREGYDFKGWAENPDDEAAKYQPEEMYSDDANTTLYAVWQLKTYTVTYDANEGSGAPEVQTKTHGEDLQLSSTKPTRTGYTFKGWAETSTATIAKYQPGGTYSNDVSTTLYAVWGTAQSVITFEGNGGTFSGGKTQIKETVIYGDKLTPKPTREGHVFKGWDESPEATNVVYKYEDPYYGSEDATLYAVWEANIYMIQYNANGGNGKPEMQKKVHGIALTLSSDVPTKDGYIFKCWETSSGITYQPGGIFEINAHTTLYAVWESNTYKVTYDANGGSGAPAEQTKIHGVDLTLSTTIPTRTGYKFKGWSASSSTTTAGYPAGGTYQLDQDILLYAVWESKPYSITYDTNGGAFSDGSTTRSATIHYGSAITSDIPIRDGHQFLGWAEAETALEAEYAPGAYYYGATDIKLYAVWLAGTYTVTYHANGGSGAPAAQTKTHGVDLTLSTTIPTRTGYTFKGWSASSSTTTAGYPAGGTYQLDQDILLYAVWQADTYTVTYNANGGTGAPASQTKEYGVALTLATTKPTRTGYEFLGWATSSTATSAKYQPGATYSDNKKLDLYAVWKADTYTVKYDANGGSGVPANQTKTHDVVLTLSSSPIPTRTGYTFKGWATSSDATSATHQPGGEYKDNKNVTLYAVWESNPYVITYDTNGGAFSNGTTTRSATIHYGAAITDDIPTQEGYKFLGWAESATASEVKYEAGAHYYQAKDTTLYAVWEQVETCTIIYDINGGAWAAYNPGIKSQTVYKGEEATIPDHNFSQPAYYDGTYTFLGWHTEKDAKEGKYKDNGGKITVYDDETILYAIWQRNPTNSVTPETENTCTLKYDLNGHGTWMADPGILVADVGTTVNITKLKPLILLGKSYSFMGWSLDPKSTSVEYVYGDTITLTEDTTLYAVWRDPETQYYVDYVGNWGYLNTGSGLPGSQVKTKGVPLTLSTKRPKRDGYTFKGWATSSTATTAEYKPGATYTNDADVTLYAVWVEGTVLETYTLVYDANGGKVSPNTQSVSEGITVKLPTPTREYYKFTGWSASTGGIYSAGTEFAVYDNIEFTANWEEREKCTIKYNSNGGGLIYSGAVSQEVYKGVEVTIPKHGINSKVTVTEDGTYEFIGWSTDSIATVPEYKDGGKITISDDYEESTYQLYAVWQFIPTNSVTATTENTRTIRYDANGGEWTDDITPEILKVDVGTTVFITKLRPNYILNSGAGYSFLGWSTDPNATEGDYNYSLEEEYGKITVDRDIVLYAIWDK